MQASTGCVETAGFLQRLSATMKVLYSDGQFMRWGGRLHLAHLDVGWCVVGPGYICSVMDAEEGNAIMAKLRAEGEQRGIAIEYERSR